MSYVNINVYAIQILELHYSFLLIPPYISSCISANLILNIIKKLMMDYAYNKLAYMHLISAQKIDTKSEDFTIIDFQGVAFQKIVPP